MDRGFAVIALSNPRDYLNIGAAARAAHCYGAKALVVAGFANEDKIRKAATDTSRYFRHNPVILVDDVFDSLPIDATPVAIEVVEGAASLLSFVHPQRGFYIFGPENGSLSNDVICKCQHVVKIPTDICMNLAATVNVVLYDRLCKQRNNR